MNKVFIIIMNDDVPGMPSIAPLPSFRQGPAKCSQKATPVDILPVTTIDPSHYLRICPALIVVYRSVFHSRQIEFLLVKGSQAP
eukprot:COSAG06_NODE_586_length_14002_cov_11.579228_4_plen_84_part_00